MDGGQMTGYRVLQSLPMNCRKTAAIMMIRWFGDREAVIDCLSRACAEVIFYAHFRALKLLSKCIERCMGGQIWAQQPGSRLSPRVRSRSSNHSRVVNGRWRHASS